MRSGNRSADAIFALSEETASSYAVECISQAQCILRAFGDGFRTVFEQTMTEDAACLGEMIEATILVPKGTVRKEDSSFVDAMRNGFMTYVLIKAISGMGAYAVSYGAGTAVAIGLLSNPVGWTIAAAAGSNRWPQRYGRRSEATAWSRPTIEAQLASLDAPFEKRPIVLSRPHSDRSTTMRWN